MTPVVNAIFTAFLEQLPSRQRVNVQIAIDTSLWNGRAKAAQDRTELFRPECRADAARAVSKPLMSPPRCHRFEKLAAPWQRQCRQGY